MMQRNHDEHNDQSQPVVKKASRWPYYLLVSLILGVAAFRAVTVTVDQTEKVAVFQFGDPIKDIEEPGLHVVWPWQSITRLDNRYQLYDSDSNEIITADKKTVVTDDFTVWRVDNPTRFIQAVGTPQSALRRIDDDVYSRLRQSFGSRTYEDIVVKDREEIIATVTKQAGASLAQNAIEVAIVLVNRIELPKENKQSVYNRMIAERRKEAQNYRSQGGEKALTISSGADRQARVIIAEAKRDAARLQGAADARAAAMYAEAYQQDPDFYALMRGLEAAETAFGPDSKSELRIIVDGKSKLISPLLQ
jgi:membrane protease subunit HflC